MNDALHQARRSALTLLVFSVVCTALLAGTHLLTEHTIRANENAVKQTLISQTLPTGSYDNDPVASAVALSPDDADMLGNAGLANVYIAKRAGIPVAFVFETQADNGYGDRIRLLVGINATGTVSGVRVIAHKETPGLGSYIDSGRSEWLSQYDGRAADAAGKVNKDGGDFDRMTGTTLSARAVSGAVDRVTAYYREHATRFAALQ
ncbi:RnfABCDGE type electron transport complex subunit G [Crenobacter sp. SG2303]|uniref:Ion-translocating oxidoreductase complex subunit G n=1 Tax=Crenobacter oryzisoli TaxID=3056844 RepID=A0ABT7XJU0_9NEIS|nr:RnfABCDGE type electron transport complex subunit G [Crenobacter sp. SG2303]MDN0074052.1 RnfABCDGE type electron transport complex subunit G [Crenobacter sp. SG2303]